MKKKPELHRYLRVNTDIPDCTSHELDLYFIGLWNVENCCRWRFLEIATGKRQTKANKMVFLIASRSSSTEAQKYR